MSRLVVKCPKCAHQETVLSSRPGAELPPCPRCDGFVRMTDVTPGPGQTTQTWSTAGSKATDDGAAPEASPSPSVEPKRRDVRDLGPEPL